MKSRFSIASWLVCSLISLVLVNLALACFVSGTDLLFGQPPQLMVPVFGLIVTSFALVLVHRRSARAAEVLVDEISERESRRVRIPKSAAQAPAYLSMTIIRRPYIAAAQPPETNEWKGVIQ